LSVVLHKSKLSIGYEQKQRVLGLSSKGIKWVIVLAWMDRQSQFDGYFKEGKAESKVEDARNLKALGIPTDIIAKAIGLSPEEIAKL
jgi:hypothetical protein